MTTTTDPDTVGNVQEVLKRALNQAGYVLDHVQADALEKPTPCEEWTVSELADHLIAAPRRFITMMRGEQPDRAAAPPHVEDGWGAAFQSAADDLLDELQRRGGEVAVPLEMEIAELAVHTWDLATALGSPPMSSLDPDVARIALAFMRANLTDDNRGAAFGQARSVPEDADAYRRLAAFAGRR
ncbi:TIGR03086 family metal-binding protein [Nocardioides sp. KR10-350]|uniref:TIGR03086 family metal-binding protein n=1 Tax=Nocardioides cheoyonin TaxID=3156615 RepID=UPI0032B318DB